MRNILAVLFGILIVVLFSIFYKQKSAPIVRITGTVSPTPVREAPVPTQSLFVPYWALGKGEIETDASELIYFGIAPDESGINTQEQGYKNLSRFSQAAGSRKKLLVLRMVDSNTNFVLLKNKEAQRKIIDSTVQISKDGGFSGIILDLEVSSLPFESVMAEINDFVSLLHASGSKNNIPVSIALYGDVFYRIRPYDVATIAKNTDGVYVLAYDFHKTTGNPGPNFPLSGEERFGYDMGTMIDNFLKFYPKNKITVVLGLFGYDWIRDDKTSSAAAPVTLAQAKEQFINACNLISCVVKRDTPSGEMRVLYTDTSNQRHEVWFEDMESVAKKIEFLKTKGITSTSLWAYSYF